MTNTDNASAPPPKHEQQRTVVRRWARQVWTEPCEAIFFRWKRFSLGKFDGREELGTMPFWFKAGWVLSLPVLLVYGLVRQLLDDAGITQKSEKINGPGVISVAGSKRNPVPTSLIDTVKRAPRSLWIVFSRSRLAVVIASNDGSAPRVVWQTEETARVRFHNAAPNSIEITWPDRSRVFFYPTVEERQIVTRFVRSTWSDKL